MNTATGQLAAGRKIAVIGSGISGMAAAHYLNESSGVEVHLFESAARLGGHTATMDIDHDGESLAIDTGFIVFNDWTYPNFIALMDKLGVSSKATRMSFSVNDPRTGLEYAGGSLDTLFAQRRNLLSPAFLRMVRDIVRFNRYVEQHIEQDVALAQQSLGDYLRRFAYSKEFCEWYLLPMGAAIWSSNHKTMDEFPLHFFVRFFRNHGLLNLKNRPQWRVIVGGSRAYIAPLTESYKHNIHLNTPINQITRGIRHEGREQVRLLTPDKEYFFDEVVLACHSNQALQLLSDASATEKEVLGAIPYSRNSVVLHRDKQLLPTVNKTWSSWNVRLGYAADQPPTLTYNMNILQGLDSRHTWCVTLNQRDAIREDMIMGEYEYEHPVFTLKGIAAQARWHEINGVNRTWYCGAWWRNGFHEDGVYSALRVADAIKAALPAAMAMAS